MTKFDYTRVWLYLTTLALLALELTGCEPITFPQVTTQNPFPVTTPVPNSTPTSLVNGWQQYRNSDLGYSFSYPSDAFIKAGENKFGAHTCRLQFHLPDVGGYEGMVIWVEPNPQQLPLKEVLAQLYEQSAQEVASEEILSQVESTTVAGLPALKTSLLPINADFAILFLHQDRVFIVAPVHDPAMTALDPGALDLFNQILKTFKVNL